MASAIRRARRIAVARRTFAFWGVTARLTRLQNEAVDVQQAQLVSCQLSRSHMCRSSPLG